MWGWSNAPAWKVSPWRTAEVGRLRPGGLGDQSVATGSHQQWAGSSCLPRCGLELGTQEARPSRLSEGGVRKVARGQVHGTLGWSTPKEGRGAGSRLSGRAAEEPGPEEGSAWAFRLTLSPTSTTSFFFCGEPLSHCPLGSRPAAWCASFLGGGGSLALALQAPQAQLPKLQVPSYTWHSSAGGAQVPGDSAFHTGLSISWSSLAWLLNR